MCLFAIEQEYGLAAAGADGNPSRNAAVARDILDELGRGPSLQAASKDGYFLQNGGLVYWDRYRIETACPETSDPIDAVRYICASYRLLEEAVARRFPEPSQRPRLWVASSDPVNRTSCGSHENYNHPGADDPRWLLIPHLISRVVLVGSGGVNHDSPGVSFVVSPRALFLSRVNSTATMKDRGIIDTGHDDASRVHLINGDPLLGQLPSYLRLATTQIVLAMIRAGVVPRESVKCADAVAALHAFTRDPSCRIAVDLERGDQATAIEIQRRHQRVAEAHLGASWMPPFARSGVEMWGAALDDLERVDPTLPGSPAATRLDWAIKFSLFGRVLSRFGFDFPAVSVWTGALQALAARMGNSWEGFPDPAALLQPRGARCARKAGAVGIFEARGLSWILDLDRFVACRRAIFAADIRFGELSEHGLFRQLDRAGALQHHVPGGDDIDRAMTQPPASGRRATMRADAIRRLSGASRARFACDWDRITDRSGVYLDMTEPLDPDGRWKLADGSLMGAGHLADPGASAAPERSSTPLPDPRSDTGWLNYWDEAPVDQEA